MRKDDDVILRAKIAILELLIGKVRVRHTVRVERGAYPAFVLRARPAVHVADARDVQVVRLDAWHRGDRHSSESEILELRAELAGIAARDDERARVERATARFEIILGG